MSLRRTGILQQINQLLAQLALNVQGEQALRHQNSHIELEGFFRDFLNLVFGWQLNDANTLFGRDQDAFDLKDSTNRIAIQVTVTTDSTKIRQTLGKFIGAYDSDFDRLIFVYPRMEITKSEADYKKQLQGFDFDAKRDRICFKQILRKIQGMQIEGLHRVLTFLLRELILPPVSNKLTTSDRAYPKWERLDLQEREFVEKLLNEFESGKNTEIRRLIFNARSEKGALLSSVTNFCEGALELKLNVTSSNRSQYKESLAKLVDGMNVEGLYNAYHIVLRKFIIALANFGLIANDEFFRNEYVKAFQDFADSVGDDSLPRQLSRIGEK